MHDIRAICADPVAFDVAMARRGLRPVAAELVQLDAQRRSAQTELQEKQARRNSLAREIGQGKRSGTDTSALESVAIKLRDEMEGLQKRVPGLEADIRRILETLPNVLDPAVPDGPDE